MNKNKKDTKNILIRGLDKRSLRRIDRQLEEINSKISTHKLSRNDYLVSLLEEDADKDLLEYQKTMFDRKLDYLADLLQEYIRATNRVLFLVTNGSPEEGLNLYDDLSKLNEDKHE